MFSDEVRDKILSKEELQKLDLVTLSLVIHAIEEVLEEVEDDKQSLSDKMYYTEPMSESNYDRAKRNYTETKEMHKNNTPEDKEHKMKSLDSYTKELASDITGMVADMSAEEKNLLRTKLSTLVSKI